MYYYTASYDGLVNVCVNADNTKGTSIENNKIKYLVGELFPTNGGQYSAFGVYVRKGDTLKIIVRYDKGTVSKYSEFNGIYFYPFESSR